nr:hypothetical protein [Tanacetum cinerariifolium]
MMLGIKDGRDLSKREESVKDKIKKSLNFCTLITPTENVGDVVVPLESIKAISERNRSIRLSDSPSTALIVEKIDKIKRLLIDGKVTLVDDKGKPLENVDSSGDHDIKDKVASVDSEMTSFLASKKVGYGTNSLLEQWKETYKNADYDYDQSTRS